MSIHSYTPVFKGESRPWQVGVLHGSDTRLSDRLLAALKDDPALAVGDNQPYAPTDGVYHTIERHTAPLGLPGAMIEIRNDLISNQEDEQAWASLFHRILEGILKEECAGR